MKNLKKAGTKERDIKKVLYPVSAVVLVLGLGVGAILLSMLNVQASTEMMPGIEQILADKSNETPFRILELVNDSADAEIGYYISGQEPYLTQYKYTPAKEDGTKGETQTFSSVEEGLSILPTKEERQKFVEASDSNQIKNPLNFSWNADKPGTTSEVDYPLSFKSYAEKYFLSKTDDATKWNRVDLKEKRRETLTGHYEENSTGKGDYTKEEQKYYSIREDVDSDGSTTQKYRENIKSFFYSDDTEPSAPYQLSFEGVENSDVNNALNDDNDTTIADAYDYSKGGFGYYENVYGELTSMIAENIAEKKYTFPGENPTVTDSASDDLTGGEDDGTATQNDVTTAGTQVNPKIYRGENIDEHPYYKYTLVGDLNYVKEEAEKNKNISNRKDGDITLEDGQYWYWTEESTDNGDDSGMDTQSAKISDANTSGDSKQSADSSDIDNADSEKSISAQAATGDNIGNDTIMKKEALYIVTGRQAVSENQVKAIPEDFTYNYYYKVRSIKYCSKLSEKGKETESEAYTYYGWYYASHPSNEDIYIKVADDAENASEETDISNWNTKATHYISEAQYNLTPGKGSYDFVEGTSTKDTKQSVEIDHLFYQGGYTNHDWFKHYIFHLDPNSKDETIQKQFKNLSIKVDTKVINTKGTGTDVDELSKSDLDKYDLIYINGRLSSSQAVNIAATIKLPVIINQAKAMGTTADKKVIEDAFAAYVDEEYVDNSCVSERIYFTDSDLCNLKFHTNFTATQLDSDAFSEIVDYIKSENNYREVVESGENGKKTAPLDTNISQARVVEYIINYQYKRQKAYKSTVNVLDIEPASVTASLTEDTVKKWLGQNESNSSMGEIQRGTIRDYCCQERKANGSSSGGDAGEKTNGGVDKIIDGDAATYWHSLYSKDINENANKEKPHWFEYKLSSQDRKRTLTGIHFVAKKGSWGGDFNGRPYELQLEIHKTNGTVITETAHLSESADELKKWTNSEQDYYLTHPIKKVDYIRVIFSKTYSDPAGEANEFKSADFATCAEFSTLYEKNTSQNSKINITHMTSSEFVGHIDDINTEYDAIYFGDSYSNWYFLRNGDVDANNKKTSLYAHVGGVFGGDKDPEDLTNHRRWNSRLMGLLDDDYTDLSKKVLRSSVKSTLPEKLQNKIGLMRGSGNDITKQQLKELNNFVSSGYPVIIGDGLLNTDKNAINTNVVDSASYMYQFLNKAISSDKVNVMSKSEADVKENLNFFFYLSKPEIMFLEMPKEPQRLNDGNYAYNEEAEVGNIQQNEDGLRYTFTIENNSEISTATATYNCELFIDLNFDGNLSSNEEQSEYIQIQDSSGNVIRKENGKYHLKIGEKYTLTRKIPKDYYKVITWKLQISNNDNPAIRTSRIGFTKRAANENEKKQVINVLQLTPKANSKAPITWKLDEDTQFMGMLNQVDGFEIKIKRMDTQEYKNAFAKNKNMLDEYQMIIIGFADGFGIDTIPNDNKEVDAIREFIEKGKSVIFAHDTTSFINRETSGPNKVTVSSDMPTTWIWGYTLNTYLRASVGMDRYGITSDAAIKVGEKSSTVSTELKKGNDLSSENKVFKAIQEKVSDMAYMFGNKNITSFMTQGFSNNVLYHVNGVQGTHKASKVNEGAITQYPYYITDTISTALTHSQYYQLALEEDSDKDGTNDIVVWYCLADSNGADSSYKNSPNDVRNNYYFYSKGNVIYTGVGHAGNNSPKEGNLITDQERQLFANAVIAAANVSAVEPEAMFLDDFDPVSEQEEYRYYMPDRLKASEISGTSNILNGDNTFNIRIRDYNMVASNLNYKDNNSGSLTMELYVQDDANGKEMTINGDKVKVTKISTSGKVNTLKKYSDGQTIKVQDDGTFKLPGNDTFQFTLDDMESYLKEENSNGIPNGNYKKECRIFAKIKSTVILYGSKADKETWASISLKPRQLFDLD